MKKENRSNKGTTMTLEMNPTRAATMRKILADPQLADPQLLNHLNEQDREELIDLYIKTLEKWENR
jgi:hypothetical protein